MSEILGIEDPDHVAPDKSAEDVTANADPPSHLEAEEDLDADRHDDVPIGSTEDELDEAPSDPRESRYLRTDGANVYGHVTQGDGNVSAGHDVIFSVGRTVRTVFGPQEPEDLARWRETYVAVSAYGVLLERLQRRSVQVLCGPSGSGMWTTAVLVLDRLNRSVETLQVDESEGLDRVKLARKGYVIEHPTSPRSAEMDNLRTRAGQAGAVVIVLVFDDSRPGLGASTLEEVPYSPPAAKDVIEKRLQVSLPNDQANWLSGELQTGKLGTAYMQWLTGTGRRIREGVALAEELCRFAAGELTETYLIGVLEAEQADPVRTWLGKATATGDGSAADPGLPDAALLLTAAVLDRFPLRYVMLAADELASRLYHLEVPEAPYARRPFRSSLTKCSRWLEVTESRSMESGLPGRLTRRVRLRGPNLATIVLDVVWHDFAAMHQPLADWFQWVTGEFSGGFRRAEPILRRVSEAVGLLATYDLEQVHRLMLSPWARGPSDRRRDVAVGALVEASKHERGTPGARSVLREWADPTSSRARQDAALRAYERGVNLPFVADTRRLIDLAVRLEAHGRVVPILAALVEVGRAGVVLDALTGRTEHESHAVQCFLDLHGDVSASTGEAFISAIAEDRERLPALARFLATALTQEATVRRAWPLLRDWIKCVDARPDLLPPLADLLGGLAADWRLRARLRFLLRSWTHQFNLPDHTIRTIRTQTDRDRSEGSNGHGATRPA